MEEKTSVEERVEKHIENLISFADKYITFKGITRMDRHNPNHSNKMKIVKEGNCLLLKTHHIENKQRCSSSMTYTTWSKLQYWTEIVRLITHRIRTQNKLYRSKSICESYNTFRYKYIGLPTIMYPTTASSVMKLLTLFLLALSAFIQLLRLQYVDGQVSFWSQIAALLGGLVAIGYFSWIGNFDLAIPYLGGCIVTSITIWGIFMHNSEPWASL